MVEPAKPFACSMPECGMRFTNEDHLHVHTKKHDMVLQLGMEQKSAFVADQTPTPTRFIRNCEEVGLFQDLQNVAANPFDEGFKRAMEAKHCILSLESTMASADDVLHTPQMVFPLVDSGEATLYTNNHRNITISRSSSDESGTIKEFETRTISKLTNEVTTISRIVNADDLTVKHTDIQKDIETVSYKNNVIKIESNVIRKEVPILIYTDAKENSNADAVSKDITSDNDKLDPEKVPIMSQKSIDFVVDSLTCEVDPNISNAVAETTEKNKSDAILKKPMEVKPKIPNILRKNVISSKKQPKLMPKVEEIKVEAENDDYEVFIKLPNGKQVRMKPVESKIDTKEVLRKSIARKAGLNKNDETNEIVTKQAVQKCFSTVVSKVVNIPTGTLIPVTLVNQQGTPLTNDDLVKVPMTKINNVDEITKLNQVTLKLPNTVDNMPKIVRINSVHSNSTALGNKPEIVLTNTQIPVENTCNIKISEPYEIDKNTGKRKIQDSPANNLVKDGNGSNINDSETDNVVVNKSPKNSGAKRLKVDLVSRSAASKRYRERLKEVMRRQTEENNKLKAANDKLISEKAALKQMLIDHLKKCSNIGDLIIQLNQLI